MKRLWIFVSVICLAAWSGIASSKKPNGYRSDSMSLDYTNPENELQDSSDLLPWDFLDQVNEVIRKVEGMVPEDLYAVSLETLEFGREDLPKGGARIVEAAKRVNNFRLAKKLEKFYNRKLLQLRRICFPFHELYEIFRDAANVALSKKNGITGMALQTMFMLKQTYKLGLVFFKLGTNVEILNFEDTWDGMVEEFQGIVDQEPNVEFQRVVKATVSELKEKRKRIFNQVFYIRLARGWKNGSKCGFGTKKVIGWSTEIYKESQERLEEAFHGIASLFQGTEIEFMVGRITNTTLDNVKKLGFGISYQMQGDKFNYDPETCKKTAALIGDAVELILGIVPEERDDIVRRVLNIQSNLLAQFRRNHKPVVDMAECIFPQVTKDERPLEDDGNGETFHKAAIKVDPTLEIGEK